MVFIWLVLNNPQLQPVLFVFLLLSLTVYLSSHALSKENPFLTRSCDFPQSQSAALRVDSDVRYCTETFPFAVFSWIPPRWIGLLQTAEPALL